MGGSRYPHRYTDAVYYPWIKVYDPSINDVRLIPPAGHVFGIYARSNIERGVHKAPANAVVGGALDEAFSVVCDRTTMTQDDTDNGRLICVIGIAPVRPAEFVIFRISQKMADAG